MNFFDFNSFKKNDFGGKANSLSTLYNAGYNVPFGFVISAEDIKSVLDKNGMPKYISFENEKVWIKNKLQVFDRLLEIAWLHALNIFGDNDLKLAIRSSANLEDGNSLSFAGMFSSVLQISNFEEFKRAFANCLLSKYSGIVVSYCKKNKINPQTLQLNFIVQKMIDADYAGVAFTVNPTTGNAKQMVIESVAGLGENLVQGNYTPNSYYINWFDEKIEADEPSAQNFLSSQNLKKLADICIDIQQFYGSPQDIEWAIKNDHVYILQSRPLTAILYDTTSDWTNANLKDGGISSEITTPFMYGLFEYIFENTMPKYLKSVGLHPMYPVKKWFTQFMFYPYWNLSATKDGLKKIPGFDEMEFDTDLGVGVSYKKGHKTPRSPVSMLQGIKVLTLLNNSINNTISNFEKELSEIDNIIKKYPDFNVNKFSKEKLVKKLKTLFFEDYLKVEGSYFWVIYNNSNNSTIFKDLFNKKNRDKSLNYLRLISGLQDVSHLKPVFELWEISREILKNEKMANFFRLHNAEDVTQKFLNNEKIPLQKKINRFIKKYEYHSEKELDILTPNWDENPKQVFVTLVDFLKKSENVVEKNKQQFEIFKAEFDKIKSQKLKNELKKHRKLLWIREEYRDRSSQMYHILRKTFLQVGKILKSEGKISANEDVFFLQPSEVITALESGRSFYEKVKQNKAFYNSFRNFKKPNEIFSKNKKLSDLEVVHNTKIIKGIASSYGVFEGEVFFARTTTDADKMPEGKILLTEFTNPAWTVYFSKIKGLITETGGMLSHGAVIAREYGVPAVLGVKNARKLIKHGTKIRIDGSDGKIYIL